MQTESPEPTEPEKRAYSAPALEKGLDILELLATTDEPLSTRRIAASLGRSKAEIFRMVFVLVERGYLIRDEADRLVLTNRLFELGMRTPKPRELTEAAVPLMERMSSETGQSSHLVVVNRGETVVVATAAGGSDFSFSLKLGYRRPAIQATSGLLVLAFQPETVQAKAIAESASQMRLQVDPSDVRSELAAIRERGYLIAESRDVAGVTDIGCPVLGPDGWAVASIVIPCLTRHDTEPDIEGILAALRTTCSAITSGLT